MVFLGVIDPGKHLQVNKEEANLVNYTINLTLWLQQLAERLCKCRKHSDTKALQIPSET